MFYSPGMTTANAPIPQTDLDVACLKTEIYLKYLFSNALPETVMLNRTEFT